jgi:hypothetical protein
LAAPRFDFILGMTVSLLLPFQLEQPDIGYFFLLPGANTMII